MSKEALSRNPESEKSYSDDILRHLGEFAIELFGLGPKKEINDIFHPIKAMRNRRS